MVVIRVESADPVFDVKVIDFCGAVKVQEESAKIVSCDFAVAELVDGSKNR